MCGGALELLDAGLTDGTGIPSVVAKLGNEEGAGLMIVTDVNQTMDLGLVDQVSGAFTHRPLRCRLGAPLRSRHAQAGGKRRRPYSDRRPAKLYCFPDGHGDRDEYYALPSATTSVDQARGVLTCLCRASASDTPARVGERYPNGVGKGARECKSVSGSSD